MGLMHARRTCLVEILARGWGGPQGGIIEAALAHQESWFGQMRLGGLKQGPSKAASLRQPTELQQRGGIRRRFAPEGAADEAANGPAALDRTAPLALRRPRTRLSRCPDSLQPKTFLHPPMARPGDKSACTFRFLSHDHRTKVNFSGAALRSASRRTVILSNFLTPR